MKKADDTFEAVVQSPPPSELRMVLSFLDLANDYFMFMPHIAMIVEPLRNLLRKVNTVVGMRSIMPPSTKIRR